MLIIVTYIFTIIIALMFLITIHEFAHYCFARLFSVQIIEFAIGFGKPLVQWENKRGEIIRINRFPVGGYVKMLNSREQQVPEFLLKHAFDKIAIWKRFVVIAVGPLVNIVFAFVCYWFGLTLGISSPLPYVETVFPNTPAASAGMPAGSYITQIDEHKIQNWGDITVAITLRLGEQTPMTVKLKPKPNEAEQEYSLDLRTWQYDWKRPDPLRSLGIYPRLPLSQETRLHIVKYPFFQAFKPAYDRLIAFVHFNGVMIYKIASGQISFRALGGPFSFIEFASLSMQAGLASFLLFLGYISFLVGLINLLPLPGLDGGHLLYLLLEKIRGKPVSVGLEVLLYRISLIVLVVFSIQVTLNDFLRYAH